MKHVIPFQNSHDAVTTLDNGGRFYNLFSEANNGQISTQEVARVAGLFTDKQKIVLYFAISIGRLKAPFQDIVKSAFTEIMKQAYERYKPQELPASVALTQGVISSNAIITGIPKMVESKRDFKGFIFVPPGVMIPIIDRYDIYEMRDHEHAEPLLIAHARGPQKLPEEMIRVAGVLKEIKLKVDGVETKKMFLEALYYADGD
ncbi:hypothetical protein MUGA111182_20300 [Mucilaginibacter galii]|uniref:Uncharacterized protein n=1 Tax=Mucilaginibacter galii TaxID=2005073 RepID=A0A917JB46_9SPHI|nr:hypothetical protein [Mucilaginibacter galii]GGI52480.1 hypothetical protein GCM10011425_36920 [Mucilaginibacter galii]